MLGDYAVHGAVLRRYSRSIGRLAGGGVDTVARFQAWLRTADRAASTVRTYTTVAGEFVAFLDTRGGMARCDAGAVEAFVATLAGYQFKTVEQKLCALRAFLRFASGEGLVDAAVLDAVPAVRSRKQTRVPSVWDLTDVTKILDAVDRGNPCGKRDYAIILLVTRLGLRGIDIKRLKFSDFDWPGNRMSLSQAKTGHRVWLPLLKDVGWAVIDYVRSGRPVSDCPQVFIRHTAPIGPFSDQDHLHQILVARPGGPCPSQRETPPRHAFAQTPLATRLMEDGTRSSDADILGHQSVGSTGVYLKSSLGMPKARWIRTARSAGVTVTPDITLADAIAALVAQKRAVGYRYAAEARVLARFEAFCRVEFPGLGTVSQVSVEAWVASARRRGVRPATLQTLAAPVRELARWLGHRGVLGS
jgi:integrase